MKSKETRDHDTVCAASLAQTAVESVTVPYHVAAKALQLAEQTANEVNVKLREAEAERDKAVRVLANAQQNVDILIRERDYRTRHVRELLASLEP